MSLFCLCIEGRGLRSASGDRTSCYINTRTPYTELLKVSALISWPGPFRQRPLCQMSVTHGHFLSIEINLGLRFTLCICVSWDDGFDEVVCGCWELEEFGIEEETLHKQDLILLITESLSHHQISIDKNGLKGSMVDCRLCMPSCNVICRGPTEIVQHSAYWESSHRRNVASSHIFNMVWLYLSPIPVGGGGWGIVQMKTTVYLPSQRLEEGKGEVSTLWALSVPLQLLIWLLQSWVIYKIKGMLFHETQLHNPRLHEMILPTISRASI